MSVVTVTGQGACLSESGVRADADWFDVTTALGRRGYRSLPLPAQLTLAAVRELPATPVSGDRAGTWLGSATAAAHCLDDLDTGILRDGTGMIPPTGAPYFSVNLVPARAVREMAATGPSVTVTSAGTAGLDALLAATRAVHLGRVEEATVVLVEVPDRDTGELPVSECGALAFRLRAGDDGARVRGAARFVPSSPGAAADAVLDVLAPAPETVVFGARPGHAPSHEVTAADGGPLAAAALLADAAAQRRAVTVLVLDPLGGATGVTLDHRSTS